MKTVRDIDHATLLAALAESRERVVPLLHEGAVCWLKRAVPVQLNLWHGFQGWFYAMSRVPLLKPSWTADPALALAKEARRLETLGKEGFRVPRVMRLAPEYLLLADAGREVHEIMRDAELEMRISLVRGCATLLAGLHRAGLWHGRGSLRDFVVNDAGELGFIDCEEDASGLGSWAQPRDLLLFCQSVARFDEDGTLVKEAFTAYDHAPVKEKLAGALRWLSPPVLLLRPLRHRLGRDLRQMLAMCEAIRP